MIEKRFGQPERVIQEMVEGETKMTHWLYPEKGLDVAMDEKGNVVMQYVSPDKFEQLVGPLK